MLIQPDIHELGDKRLDPIENVARKREECLAMASKKRLYKQDELEDPDRAYGPRLQFSEMVSKLRQIAPSLRVLNGSPGNVALYVRRDREEMEEAITSWQNDKNVFFLYHKYVGGFPKHELQEYGTVDVDNARLATKEKRSWRTVLIMLLQQGVVSYQNVVKVFGDVGTDRRGWRWREQTRLWRNHPTSCFVEVQN